MRRWFARLFANIARRLSLKIDNTPEVLAENRILKRLVADQFDASAREQSRREQWERVAELIEARAMAGAGPWRVPDKVLEETDRLITYASQRIDQNIPRPGGIAVREAMPIIAQGATGDIELALQNVEWRREVNLSWLEFSRWGIQQLILISRLQFIKHPWIQRGINVTASYVFGRGVEVSSEDDDANDVIADFAQRNKKILGQAALSDLHKQLMYDGQVFYCFFADDIHSGEVDVRTIDATEIQEIITDPDDTDCHQYYRRKWTSRKFVASSGMVSTVNDQDAYYPALKYAMDNPGGLLDEIGGVKVMTDCPVLMQKGGVGVGKWLFDTPKVYAALEWARNGTRMLQADLTTRLALSQIAMTLTTKGGQQALEGAKTALGTTVGPTSNLYDMNPPAVSGATFGSGPGTTLAAFDTRGAIRDPKDVAEYRNMVACVFEIPPTFLADMETSNLSTAQTLDRPTELAMMEKQERWRETLVTIYTYVLQVSQGATNGKLRESKDKKVVEMARTTKPNGQRVYVREASQSQPDDQIQIKVIFPAIREGDMPANVTAIAEAMTLGNTQGQVVGIDEKTGVMALAEELGLENYQDVLDKQYPKKIFGKPGKPGYDPNRTLPPPKPPAAPAAVHPPNPPAPPHDPNAPAAPAPAAPAKTTEAVNRLLGAILRLKEKRNAVHKREEGPGHHQREND
jgi:hypothetical protein